MIYVPDNFLNSDYYSFSNDTIISYNNCVNNVCDCNNIYTNFDYNISDTYSCSLDNNNLLNKTLITDDIYYRVDFVSILLMFLIFSFIIIYCPIVIITRFFRRFSIK